MFFPKGDILGLFQEHLSEHMRYCHKGRSYEISKKESDHYVVTADPVKEKSHEKKLKNQKYEKELAKLQVELVKLQEWIRHKGLKVLVIFEGRDAAGKGGVIKRVTQSLSPRVCRVGALAAPTAREKNQWYFQKDEMFHHTDIKQAPWYVVDADSKKRARLNCIHHLLSCVPYKDLTPESIKLPPRQKDTGYVRPPLSDQAFVPEKY